MVPSGVIQLLDSAQGHPLQTWRIENLSRVTIGRAEENDVVVSDPHVSRSHAYLQFDKGQWRLFAVSRLQVAFQGELHGELPLADGMVFRLGQNGCYLRFGCAREEEDDCKTITVDTDQTPILTLDRRQLEREVDQIIDGEYFQSLKNAAELRRRQRFMADTKGT